MRAVLPARVSTTQKSPPVGITRHTLVKIGSMNSPPPSGPRPVTSPVTKRRAGRWRRQAGKLILIPVVPLLVWVSASAFLAELSWNQPRTDLLACQVRYDNIQRMIIERGNLDSAARHEITCRVKARKRGSLVASTLIWVIEDGSQVKKGDLLIQLDDSALDEELKLQQITAMRARFDMLQAEANCRIVENQNEADQDAARCLLQLADLDLRKYLEGDLVQTRRDLDGRLLQAESTLDMWHDRLAWSGAMMNRGFVSPNAVANERSKLRTASLSLDKVREERRVHDGFAKIRTETELRSRMLEAERSVVRAAGQARARKTQAEIDCRTKQSIHEDELKQLRAIEEQIELCTIRAPRDGCVVYFVSEQQRYGSGSQRGLVAQGEPVREGQKLLYMPDLSRMVAITRVHEAQRMHVNSDVTRQTGFTEVLEGLQLYQLGTLAPLIGSFAWDELRAQFHESDHALVSEGDPALVRVEAFPDQVFRGHVKHVATMPSQREYENSGVKVFPTTIAIDEEVEGLRPGMTVDVHILAGKPVSRVLAVPVQAIVGTLKKGGEAKVFVLNKKGQSSERPVVLGHFNETLVQIQSGLEEGEQVVLNPKAVQPEGR